MGKGVFFTEALAEFQHVNCMIVYEFGKSRELHAMLARVETFTEAVVSVASMVATPLVGLTIQKNWKRKRMEYDFCESVRGWLFRHPYSGSATLSAIAPVADNVKGH